MTLALGASILNRGLQSGHLDGIGIYTRHLLEGLQALGQPVTPYVFSGDAAGGLTPGFRRFPGAFGPSLFAAAMTGMAFPGGRSVQGRLFHATDHRIPRLRHMPVLATLMDPVPLMRSDWVTPAFRGVKNWLFRRSAQWADRVIAISEAAAVDLEIHFRIPRPRITVIPLGVDAAFAVPMAAHERLRRLSSRGLGENFFLFIGTLQPRKNVDRLLDAYLSLPSAVREAHPLVIAGRNGWGADALVARLRALKAEGQVHWLDYVSDEEKHALLQSARALVFPSLYEGFGLPVLEAFAAGLPVVTANTTALPEVAGDAALLVDPLSVEAIADGMARLAASTDLCADLQARGRQRVAQFSWERCVGATVAVYREMGCS